MTAPAPTKNKVAQADSPTTDALRPGDFSSVLDRNIEALKQRRRGEEAKASSETRVAEGITRFTGSMVFVYLHVVIVLLWVGINLEWVSFVPAFDKTFVILATVTSVEGIFLSTFVLISQNRAAAAADRRAELDVQVNLLSEHEITQLLHLTIAVAEKLGMRATRASRNSRSTSRPKKCSTRSRKAARKSRPEQFDRFSYQYHYVDIQASLIKEHR